MSLPTAPKDVSIHPKKGSVVEPVDKAKKEKDIAQKLKLYTTIQALRASRLPSNAQIDSFLSYIQTNVDRVKTKDKSLSKDTVELFTDFNAIIQGFKDEVSLKNGDELIQEFVWRTRVEDMSGEIAEGLKTTKSTETPVTKEKAKDDANQALGHMRTLLKLLTTNSEARKLLSDLSLVGRDLVSRTTIKAANAIAPPPEALAAVDESTKRDEFVEPDDKFAAAPRPMKESASSQSVPEVESSDEEVTVDGTTKKKGLFNKLTSRIPDKHKSNAKDQFAQGRKFLTEEYFPQDRREQWIWRAKKVIIECQSHPEYQSSLEWLLDFVEQYFGHGKTLAAAHGDKLSTHVAQGETTQLNQTFQTIVTILDRFANNKSLDDLVLSRMQTIAQDAKDDQELRDWWSRVGKWIRRLLVDPGYIVEPKSESDGRKLADEGKKFYGTGDKASPADTTPVAPTPIAPTTLDTTSPVATTAATTATTPATTTPAAPGKYKQHLDTLLDGLGDWTKGSQEDAGNRKFASSLSKFTNDLLYVDAHDGAGGRLSLKREMWGDLRRVVVPLLVEKVGYIPIPRIEYSDDDLDLVVENLTLSGKNLFPNIVSVEAHNYMHFSPYGSIAKDDSRHEFIITLSQIQADLKDVAFYFERKTGIKIMKKDSGLADVVIGGEGVNVTIHLVSSNDPSSYFEVKNINVKIDSLKFAIRDSKHDLFYKTFRPLATGLIKRQIAKAIKDGIATGLGYVDGQLIGVRDRIHEAKAQAAEAAADGAEGKDPKDAAISTFGVFQEVFKRSKSSNASEMSSSTSGGSPSQFKMVSNKRNSILAHKGHPAGWVNRTTDKDEFGKQDGDKGWQTDAFDIQNADAKVASPTVGTTAPTTTTTV
ncbi:hypothetical protein C8J56DRAFT_865456 [Mycena floridula]|nr:hypothetical protein C8J56DRAFT_865456 [Mycena floridula]